MPEFYTVIARKYFFPICGRHVPPAPVSYAYEYKFRKGTNLPCLLTWYKSVRWTDKILLLFLLELALKTKIS